MDEFFQKSFWSPVPNMLIYEVFTKELPMSDKVQFIERMLGKNIYAAGIDNHFENRYGRCDIEQTKEGISIEYYDGEGTKWKTELDWWDCAAYVESMIADGVYQTYAPYSEIDRVLDVRRAASLKAGGMGIRYTVRINGKQSYLFYEEPRWFVEAKV